MKDGFEYKYSAPTNKERKEIESIRDKYSFHSESNKLVRLKSLDLKVRNIPVAVSFVIGIIGILIFGFGLTMVLEWKLVLAGIVIGALGCVAMACALPMYKKLSSILRAKYSGEIVKLSDELLKDE